MSKYNLQTVDKFLSDPKNNRGHEWRLDKFGEIDTFGLEVDNHNGPKCIRCGYCFCLWCQDGPDCD